LGFLERDGIVESRSGHDEDVGVSFCHILVFPVDEGTVEDAGVPEQPVSYGCVFVFAVDVEGSRLPSRDLDAFFNFMSDITTCEESVDQTD